MKGYVYVLTNEAMPGLVKIGRSKHAAGVRAKAMYKGDTGVPLPFDVHFECLFDDCVEGEGRVHEYLEMERINPNREFFRMDADDATLAVIRVLAGDYFDHSVESVDFIIDPPMLWDVARSRDMAVPEIVSSFRFLDDSAWDAAIEKYREWVELRRQERASLKVVAGDQE